MNSSHLSIQRSQPRESLSVSAIAFIWPSNRLPSPESNPFKSADRQPADVVKRCVSLKVLLRRTRGLVSVRTRAKVQVTHEGPLVKANVSFEELSSPPAIAFPRPLPDLQQRCPLQDVTLISTSPPTPSHQPPLHGSFLEFRAIFCHLIKTCRAQLAAVLRGDVSEAT